MLLDAAADAARLGEDLALVPVVVERFERRIQHKAADAARAVRRTAVRARRRRRGQIGKAVIRMAVIDLGIGQALAALIFCQLHGLPLLSRAGIADGLQGHTVKGDRAHRLQRRRERHGLQRCAPVEQALADGRDALGNVHHDELAAAGERIVRKRLESGGQPERHEIAAVGKRASLDGGDALRDRQRGQTLALAEGADADRSQRIGQLHAREIRAAVERPRADGRHAGRDAGRADISAPYGLDLIELAHHVAGAGDGQRAVGSQRPGEVAAVALGAAGAGRNDGAAVIRGERRRWQQRPHETQHEGHAQKFLFHIMFSFCARKSCAVFFIIPDSRRIRNSHLRRRAAKRRPRRGAVFAWTDLSGRLRRCP